MPTPTPKTSEKLAAGTLAFVRELATHYMDFLETDFHRRKNSKRSVRFRNADNLLVGVNLGRYPTFVHQCWKLIRNGFKKGTLDRILKGAYRTTIPQPVFELIKLEAEKISEDGLTATRGAISRDILDHARANRADYEKALTDGFDASVSRICSELVLPFVGRIKKPLERLDLGDENALYLVEQELGDLLMEPARNKISELVGRIVADQAVDVAEELRFAFSAAPVQRSIRDFFAGLDRRTTILLNASRTTSNSSGMATSGSARNARS